MEASKHPETDPRRASADCCRKDLLEQLIKMNPQTAAATRSKSLVLIGLLLLLAIVITACGGARSQAPASDQQDFSLPTPVFPNRTIDIIVGAEAGSPEDKFAAAIGAAYATALGGQINFVYEPGNNGLTALDNFGAKDNDGHIMLIVSDRHLSAIAAGETTVDVTREHLPKLLGVKEPLVIYAGATDSSLSDWDAVVSAAGSGSVTVASGGPDSSIDNLSVSVLAADLGIDLDSVTIDVLADRLAAPGAGTADLVIARVSDANNAAGLNPILVLWPERIPSLDSVPTALESGSSFEGLAGMLGVAINRRTPSFVGDEIGRKLRAAFASPEYQAWLAGNGLGGVDVPLGDPGFSMRLEIPKMEAAAGG